MNRRAFIQGLIGLATMPMLSKYINVFRPSAVREGITKAADNTMQKGIEFYEAVIKRVMDEGSVIKEEDRWRTYKHPDKPDINVELNVGTGDTAVYFETDVGRRAGAEITSDLEVPQAGKELMEHEEVMKTMSPEGDYYKAIDEEITGGIGGLEEWINRKRNYAAGGRVGMWRGGVPKGLQAALRAIRSKFGDDIIKTADEVERPPGAIATEETAQAVNDFNLRNPMSITETVNVWEDPVKLRAAVDDIFSTGDYKMDAQMAAEALVENNPQAFNDMLYDDLDDRTQMKIYGAVLGVVQSDLGKMLQLKRASRPTKTLEGIENTGTINISDPNVAEEFARFMKETDPKGHRKIEEIVELTNFKPPKGRKGNAKGGRVDDAEVNLTVIKIPDISGSGVETLFERR